MQVNDMIHGFQVKQIRPLDEIQAEMYEMVRFSGLTERAVSVYNGKENQFVHMPPAGGGFLTKRGFTDQRMQSASWRGS